MIVIEGGSGDIDDNGGIFPNIADVNYPVDYFVPDSGTLLGFSLDKRQ